MYYDIVESGLRIRKMRAVRSMTRQNLADEIGISVDALRKIEKGTNGAKIDTLVSIAQFLCISLDYLVCGCERKTEIDALFAGLKETEKQFIQNMVLNVVEDEITKKLREVQNVETHFGFSHM